MKRDIGNRKQACSTRGMRADARRASRWTGRMVAALLSVASLTGCALLGGKGDPATIYAPSPRIQAEAAWPSMPWQLTLATSTGAPMIDSQRIAVRPTPNELQVYKGASWAKRPTDMLEDALLRTLEDSGKVRAAARTGSGVNADYRLVLDLRRFESEYAGAAVPSAVIEVNAKLLHAQDEQVVATRTFLQRAPAATTAVADVVAAFEQALADTSHAITGWTLASGQAHGHAPAR